MVINNISFLFVILYRESDSIQFSRYALLIQREFLIVCNHKHLRLLRQIFKTLKQNIKLKR